MKKDGVLVGVMLLIGAYLVLPALASIVGGALDEVVLVLVAIAPKVAVVSGLAALIMLCIPFMRRHASGMLVGAILLAIGAAGFSTVVAWLGAHSGVITADVLGAANAMLARGSSQGG